jgi:hypothetical protein
MIRPGSGLGQFRDDPARMRRCRIPRIQARCAQTLGRPLVKDAMRYETWETAQSRLKSLAARRVARIQATLAEASEHLADGRYAAFRPLLEGLLEEFPDDVGLAAEVAAVVAGPSPPRWRTRWSGLRELAKADDRGGVPRRPRHRRQAARARARGGVGTGRGTTRGGTQGARHQWRCPRARRRRPGPRDGR